jgi:hypothetical protein
VNLARKDKQAEPTAQVLLPEQVPVRQDGDATVRVLMGEGSPVHLGTPALILDVELPTGGQATTSVPTGFQGFAYVLDGEAPSEPTGAGRGLRTWSCWVPERGLRPSSSEDDGFVRLPGLVGRRKTRRPAEIAIAPGSGIDKGRSCTCWPTPDDPRPFGARHWAAGGRAGPAVAGQGDDEGRHRPRRARR